jgi:predicted lipid carrier protein YhbT
LPSFVAPIASRLPQFVPSAALAAALELGLKRLVARDALHGLDGKILRIVVRDAGVTMTVRCRNARFHLGFVAGRADVTIAASLADFVLLALREEDPDTLFFARRLAMEGDTEVGLMVKNLFDSADLSPIANRLRVLSGRRR